MKRTLFQIATVLFVFELFGGGNSVAYAAENQFPVTQNQNTGKIVGTVVDASGVPIAGASVIVVGTTTGTFTDVDGNFEMKDIASDAKLQISFIGFETRTIAVDGRASYKVVLKEDSTLLDEGVVTGYGGKQLRSKLTNSIAKVSEETFSVGAFSNPAQALAGTVSGSR